MKYLLDSNIIIALVSNEDSNVIRRAANCYDGDIVTSVVAYAEVLYGAVRGKPPGPAQLSSFEQEVPVLDFDLKAAQAYAQLPFKRASYDQLIAAHALSHGLILVTHNERHFIGIDGLLVENWFSSDNPDI